MTEFVGSLPTKTPTFSGDALGDVLMCTCLFIRYGKGLSGDPSSISGYSDRFLSFRSISELRAWLRVGNLWIGLYSPLDFILHGCPMDTSMRILLDPFFLGFCMNGIQFPTDHLLILSILVCVS